MHCDYKLLELLALRLNYVFPKAQQYECYNALLPVDAIGGDSSSRLGNHAEKKLSCREKIRWICTHGGCTLSPEDWEAYLSAPLDFLIARGGMIAELFADEKAAFKFFLGSAEEPLLKTFAANVGDAYLHDLAFESDAGNGHAERVQLTTEVHLYEMLANREDTAATVRSARKLLAELLGWMLGSTQGQDTMNRLVTKVGGRSHTVEEGAGSLILAVCQDSTANVLGLADIDPWICEAAGFGHLYREGSYETNVKVPKGPLIEQVRGAFDLPTPDVQLTDNGKTVALSPVSREHAAIARQNGTWKVYDLGSSNGTVLRRRMKNGSAAYVIVGLGKGNERYCPKGFFDTPGDAVLLKNAGDTLVLKPGMGFSVMEEDDICLGFKLEKKGKRLSVTPLEGAIFLRVMTSS